MSALLRISLAVFQHKMQVNTVKRIEGKLSNKFRILICPMLSAASFCYDFVKPASLSHFTKKTHDATLLLMP